MESDNENEDIKSESPETEKTPDITSQNRLPEKSRKFYEIAYNQFMTWKQEKKLSSFSEGVFVAYFSDLSKKYKSSTLWTYYSMLRSTINIHHNVKIERYRKLNSFLKRKGENYKPKKVKTLSLQEINKFITEAPDVKYLRTKVALIMGIMGACSTNELHAMQVNDVQELYSTYSVTISNDKTKECRKFKITGNFYKICKKYFELRPPQAPTQSLFLHYQNGKCNSQGIGINKFGQMAKEVARYLKLPDSELFTGHCFRRSSATLLANGKDGNALGQLGGGTTEHTEENLNNNMQQDRKIIQPVILPKSSSSTSTQTDPISENYSNIFRKDANFTLNEALLQLSNSSATHRQKLDTFMPATLIKQEIEDRNEEVFDDFVHDTIKVEDCDLLDTVKVEKPDPLEDFNTFQFDENTIKLEEEELLDDVIKESESYSGAVKRDHTYSINMDDLLDKYEKLRGEHKRMKMRLLHSEAYNKRLKLEIERLKDILEKRPIGFQRVYTFN